MAAPSTAKSSPEKAILARNGNQLNLPKKQIRFMLEPDGRAVNKVHKKVQRVASRPLKLNPMFARRTKHGGDSKPLKFLEVYNYFVPKPRRSKDICCAMPMGKYHELLMKGNTENHIDCALWEAAKQTDNNDNLNKAVRPDSGLGYSDQESDQLYVFADSKGKVQVSRQHENQATTRMIKPQWGLTSFDNKTVAFKTLTESIGKEAEEIEKEVLVQKTVDHANGEVVNASLECDDRSSGNDERVSNEHSRRDKTPSRIIDSSSITDQSLPRTPENLGESDIKKKEKMNVIVNGVDVQTQTLPQPYGQINAHDSGGTGYISQLSDCRDVHISSAISGASGTAECKQYSHTEQENFVYMRYDRGLQPRSSCLEGDKMIPTRVDYRSGSKRSSYTKNNGRNDLHRDMVTVSGSSIPNGLGYLGNSIESDAGDYLRPNSGLDSKGQIPNSFKAGTNGGINGHCISPSSAINIKALHNVTNTKGRCNDGYMDLTCGPYPKDSHQHTLPVCENNSYAGVIELENLFGGSLERYDTCLPVSRCTNASLSTVNSAGYTDTSRQFASADRSTVISAEYNDPRPRYFPTQGLSDSSPVESHGRQSTFFENKSLTARAFENKGWRGTGRGRTSEVSNSSCFDRVPTTKERESVCESVIVNMKARSTVIKDIDTREEIKLSSGESNYVVIKDTQAEKERAEDMHCYDEIYSPCIQFDRSSKRGDQEVHCADLTGSNKRSPSPDPALRYNCDWPGCYKSFRHRSFMVLHKRIHTGEKPYQCQWAGCEKQFRRSDEYQRHYRVHTGVKPYPCGLCRKRFKRSDHRLFHYRAIHGISKPIDANRKSEKLVRTEA
ncbi:uncharacterized protein LOC116603475 [Nematostella vectensis]|nr:uncharacterized protein LOC116603475 [Nematostella vectensis]